MKAPWPRTLGAAVFAASITLSGCDTVGERQRDAYRVSIHSQTEDGDPLPKVEILSAGKRLGITNDKGVLQAVLRGREGDERTFEVKCPQGFRAPEERPAIQLRSLRHVEGSELNVRCLPDKRMAALLVSAPGFAGLPILVHGHEVGRTDASGIAHLALRGEPRTPMRVVLDTSARPRVTPASPHKDVRIGTRDEIVVFAPELAEPEPPKPKVRKEKKTEKEEPVAPAVLRPEKLN
jgi:hypothetical protein